MYRELLKCRTANTYLLPPPTQTPRAYFQRYGFDPDVLYRSKPALRWKIKQRLGFRNLPDPPAISLFYVKEVHNAHRHEDLEVEIPLDRALIDRSRSVLVDGRSNKLWQTPMILSSSPVFSASGLTNVRNSTTQTVIFVTHRSRWASHPRRRRQRGSP